MVERQNTLDNKTIVVNIKSGQQYDVYCGRTFSTYVNVGWGNPFKVGKDGTAEECIAKYREWLLEQDELLLRLNELKGKRLGCWCKPKPCHCDIIIELIEGDDK